jgi:hypothetical protein
MITWLQTYAKTHIFYIVLIAVGLIGFRSWLQEHDARLKADDTVKQQEIVVADLKQRIASAQQQATQKVQVITKVVHDVTTTAQAVAAIPQLTNAPLNVREAVDNPAQVSVDAIPLVSVIGQASIDKTNLETCQQVSGLKDQQLTAKDVEIAALKKKPSFWKRVTGTAKTVGIGIGIGLLLSTHL